MNKLFFKLGHLRKGEPRPLGHLHPLTDSKERAFRLTLKIKCVDLKETKLMKVKKTKLETKSEKKKELKLTFL